MCQRRSAALAIAGLLSFLVFFSCGEVGSMLPASQTYQVEALSKKLSLDEFALLKASDQIQPSFIHPVSEDIDVAGLKVFFQTSKGVQAGPAVVYTIEREKAEPANETPSEKPSEAASTSSKTPTEEEPKNPPDPEPSAEASDQSSPEPSAEANDQGSPEPPTKPASSSGTTTETASQDVPEASSRDSLPPDILFQLTQLDKPLPPFTVPAELEPGPYILVFQVFGWNQETISKTEKTVYYMGNLDYEIEDIAAYLPGTTASNLIPPDCNVFFEAKIHSYGNIDPYIAWYNGRVKISSGRLSEGANRILWKTPAQTGFQQIRVEALPFPPLKDREPPSYVAGGTMLRGKMRELSLAVSSKGEIQQVLIEDTSPEKLSAYYHFAGDLKNALNRTPEKDLIPLPKETASKRKANWLPGESIYGLVIGPRDIYNVPLPPQKRLSEEWGRGSFVFRLMPVNEGVIFRASFSSGNDGEQTESAVLELALKAGNLTADLISGDTAEHISAPRPQNSKFSTITIDYLIKNENITVSLGENEISVPIKDLNHLECQLGAVNNKKEFAEVTAVMDEFAAIYSAERVPPPKTTTEETTP